MAILLIEDARLVGLRPLDAAETDVACGRIFRFCMAGGGTIAPAVVRRTKMRPALEYTPWNANLRLGWIVAGVHRSTPGIDGNAASFCRGFGVAGRPEIARPLPYISDHVVNAISV